ncbi:hypothetical protein R1sor_008800 [Riccia sorocarpa]|uniref:Uncharacterized protein n=1 Tax=Riccia sorocarpa TaxID=122646 RepID=A0ABD3I0N4_9MARC
MEDTVASSLPCDAIDSVLEEIDHGATPADSAFTISTPAVESLANTTGHSVETPAAGRGLSTSKRGNSSKKPASNLETDTEVDRGDVNARRTLWGADMSSSSSAPGGAFVNIISKYTMPFGGRLVPYLWVRNFQTTSVMTYTLKRSFETHCYMENDAEFHICPFDELGNYVDVTEEDKSKWDDLWRMESDAFDEECKAVP